MAGEGLCYDAQIGVRQSPPGASYHKEGVGFGVLNEPTEFAPHYPFPLHLKTDGRNGGRVGNLLLFCVRGSSIGSINWADRKYVIGRGVAAIRRKSNPELRAFVSAVIHNGLPHLSTQPVGAAFPNISSDRLTRLSWPPLAVPRQRAIASIFGTLDDKIELNRLMCATLERMACVIFKLRMVDFESVCGKCKGPVCVAATGWRWSQHILCVLSDRLVHVELGEIPGKWAVGKRGDVAESPRRTSRRDGIERHTWHIAAELMPSRSIMLSELSTTDGIGRNKFESNKGEILFGEFRLYVRTVGVAPVDVICSTDSVIVAPKEGRCFAFVLGDLSNSEFVEYTNVGPNGTKRPLTSWAGMACCEFVAPAKRLTEASGKRARQSGMRGSVQKSRTFAALRDAMLPKRICSQLRAKDAERIVGRVL